MDSYCIKIKFALEKFFKLSNILERLIFSYQISQVVTRTGILAFCTRVFETLPNEVF